MQHYLANGANQYAPMPGVPTLREAIAEKVELLYGRSVSMDTEITVSDGRNGRRCSARFTPWFARAMR